MGLVLIILNGIVFKEIKGASWRAKLRRQSKDSSDTIPKDALRRSSRMMAGPSESARGIEHSATIETTFIETNGMLHQLQEVFHVYLNKFGIAVFPLFLIILFNN